MKHLKHTSSELTDLEFFSEMEGEIRDGCSWSQRDKEITDYRYFKNDVKYNIEYIKTLKNEEKLNFIFT